MKDRLVYDRDGAAWSWWRESWVDDGYPVKYFFTNLSGKGLFVWYRGEVTQWLGTCDFSLAGLKDPKRAIRRFMAD